MRDWIRDMDRWDVLWYLTCGAIGFTAGQLIQHGCGL